MTNNYDKLATRAERGELKAKPGTARSGPSAAADARRLLMEATRATSFKPTTRSNKKNIHNK